jgi:hypothetical protein
LDPDSSTRSKPPASAGLRKKPCIPGSLREKSRKKSGGQVGRKGDTLRRVASPDRIVRRETATRRHCQACAGGFDADRGAGASGHQNRAISDPAGTIRECREIAGGFQHPAGF